MPRIFLIAAAMLVAAPSAFATIIGDDITILRLFDSGGTELSTPGTEPNIQFAHPSVVDNGPFTATTSDEQIIVQRDNLGSGPPLYTIDLQSSSIVFTGLLASFGSDPSDNRFNGFSLSGFSAEIASATAFNGATSINGFDNNDAWVVNNVVYVNLMGSGALAGTTFGVNLTFVQAPAPASFALMLTGLALVRLRRSIG
ncbi:MAG: hypothetical protein AAF458_03610 [Pseudomonadota bacterium]